MKIHGFYWFDFDNNSWQNSKFSLRNEKIVTVKCNSYEYFPETLSLKYDPSSDIGITRDSVEFELIFSGTDEYEKRYFIASRSAQTTLGGTNYSIKLISGEGVSEFTMLDSTGEQFSYSSCIRPIIILDSNVSLTNTGTGWSISI